jgi:hypothetical protein
MHCNYILIKTQPHVNPLPNAGYITKSPRRTIPPSIASAIASNPDAADVFACLSTVAMIFSIGNFSRSAPDLIIRMFA